MRYLVIYFFVLLNHVNCIAAPYKIGDWSVDVSNEYSEAYIYNGTNSLFGMICYDKCLFYISPSKISCIENAKYQVFMNAENEAISIDTECLKLQGRFVRIFQDFDTVNIAIRDSTFIGFAFAMKNGEFNVSRFSLNGAQNAIKQALENAIKLKNNKSTMNRDSRL